MRLNYFLAAFLIKDTPKKKAIAHLSSDRIIANQKINNSNVVLFHRRYATPYRCECPSGQNPAAPRNLALRTNVDQAKLET
jgi:hypothetical protein